MIPGRLTGFLKEGCMDSILLVSSRLANLVSVLFLVLLLAGLAMEARPELFDWVRLVSTDREGLAIALVGGIGAIGFAIIAQVLSLLRGALGDDGDALPH